MIKDIEFEPNGPKNPRTCPATKEVLQIDNFFADRSMWYLELGKNQGRTRKLPTVFSISQFLLNFVSFEWKQSFINFILFIGKGRNNSIAVIYT